MIVAQRDASLKDAVQRELRADPHVDEAEIGVAVEHRVVTLTGRVGSEVEKEAAQRAAHRAPGVLDVANDIQVKVPFALGRTDTDLAWYVRDALARDGRIPAERIQCTVYDGVVTLEGTVDSRRTCADAERVVRRIAGVRRVDDRLVVRPTAVDVGAIHRVIETALERRVAREADRIRVTVDDGIVTLEGRVDSLVEKRLVVDAVRHAPAVLGVDDRLRLEP